MRDPGFNDAVADQTVTAWGGIDVWIGNAGNPRTQYIVFDGQDSDYAPPIRDVPAYIARFYPSYTYTQIFHSGSVYVFRKTRAS